MASTVIRGAQIKDSTVQRHDLDTSTVGQAVVTKLVQGSGITLSSTGADSGTGDVTVSAAVPLADATQSGLLRQVSGNSTDFIDGTNNSQALQPVIWSVRLRSFNAIGNPNAEVCQRNISGALTNPASGTFIEDRWNINRVGTFTLNAWRTGGSQIVIPGTNFVISNAFFRFTLTGQQASLGATDYLVINQNIEGIQLRELIGDVHSTSILVQSSVAGLKFGITLVDPTGTRSLSKLCTIPSANTWTLIALPNLPVFPPAGTFNITPGNLGYAYRISLGAGSTYTAPANDTWQNGNFVGALGQDNFASKAVNSTFDTAFVQHEPGALCTTPIDCPFTTNLDSCLRYYQKTYDYAVKAGTVATNGCLQVWTPAGQHLYTPVIYPKRIAKVSTLTPYSPATGASGNIRDASSGTDRTTSGNVNSGESGFGGFTLTTPNASQAVQQFHFVVDTGW